MRTTSIGGPPARIVSDRAVTTPVADEFGEVSGNRPRALVPVPVPVGDRYDEAVSELSDFTGVFLSEWQDLNLRPPRPERGARSKLIPRAAELTGTSGIVCAPWHIPQGQSVIRACCRVLKIKADAASRNSSRRLTV
jgi:hypothetical protein